MRADAVEALEGRQAEDDDPTVGASGDEHVRRPIDLDLTDERGVALEQREQLARISRPDADGRIETAGSDAEPVERDGIDWVIVASEDPETFALACLLQRWRR